MSDPAHSFRVGGWRTEPVYSDQAEDVPEVMAARVQVYYPALDDFLWCFIPAIWPQMARVWVRDYRVRQLTRSCSTGSCERLPWTAAEYGECENDTNASLAERGLPARPAGRIWILRVPEPYGTLQEGAGRHLAQLARVRWTGDRNP